MHLKHKLAGAAAVLLALGGLGTATALANTSGSTPARTSAVTPVPEPTSATDTDNLQQGDQTTPDIPGAKEAPEANDKADSATETETGADADGPGGHQDPPGNVDHQFDGQE